MFHFVRIWRLGRCKFATISKFGEIDLAIGCRTVPINIRINERGIYSSSELVVGEYVSFPSNSG